MKYAKVVFSSEKQNVLFVFQSLKNDESVAKTDVQKILDLSHKQR